MTKPDASRPVPPRAILFDWDNTLADNWPSIQAALNAAFEAFGLETWTLEETKARVRESMRDRFPRMFGERWPEAREIFYDTFRRTHLETLRPMPEAEPMLEGLAEIGLYLGVVSNKNGDLLRREAAYLGWQNRFVRLVGAGDAERDKPAPEPVYLALADSDVTAGPSVWFAGDAAIDIECARASGCAAVLLGEGPGETAALKAHPPDLVLPDCAALHDLVQNLHRSHIRILGERGAGTEKD